MQIDAQFLENPYPSYKLLREQAPILWKEDFLGGAWIFSLYEDVAAILKDNRFSADRSYIYTAQFGSENQEKLAYFEDIYSKWMLLLDAPKHTRLRRLMNAGFKPKLMETMRGSILTICTRLLDEATADEADGFDFISDFAHIFPVLVIVEMLGVPQQDQADFIKWSDDIGAFMGSPCATLEMALQAQASTKAISDYFEGIIDERRARPGDDLVSLLIRVEEEGEVLSGDELLAQCSMLLFGGHETTRNALGNGFYALLQNPEQKQRLIDDPQLCRSAFKEFIRYDNPVQFTCRVATEDVEYKGHQIHKGQLLAPLIGSANHDPAMFNDPERFDVGRQNNRHLSFGTGAHVCIGSILAELEVIIALEQLLERFPDIRLADEAPRWNMNFGFRGLSSLPVAGCAAVAVAV